MGDLQFNDLSTGGLMLAIGAIFVILAFVKGLVKIVFSMLSLALGVAAAYWGHQNGQSIASSLVDHPDPWMTNGVAIVAGIGVFSLSRAVLGFLTSSFNATGTAKKIGFGPPAGFFGLLMGLGIAVGVLSGVRYLGTEAEVKRVDLFLQGKNDPRQEPAPLFARLKHAIDTSKLGKFIVKYDPLNDETRAKIAKIILLRQHPIQFAKFVIEDPTGEILKLTAFNRELQELAKEQNYPALLNHPDLKKVAAMPAVRESLEGRSIENALGMPEPAPLKALKSDQENPEDRAITIPAPRG